MKTRVFISNPDAGWSEIDMPEEFRKYPYDLFVSKVHKLLDQTVYKGLLITENPMPFFTNESHPLTALAAKHEIPLLTEE